MLLRVQVISAWGLDSTTHTKVATSSTRASTVSRGVLMMGATARKKKQWLEKIRWTRHACKYGLNDCPCNSHFPSAAEAEYTQLTPYTLSLVKMISAYKTTIIIEKQPLALWPRRGGQWGGPLVPWPSGQKRGAVRCSIPGAAFPGQWWRPGDYFPCLGDHPRRHRMQSLGALNSLANGTGQKIYPLTSPAPM